VLKKAHEDDFRTDTPNIIIIIIITIIYYENCTRAVRAFLEVVRDLIWQLSVLAP